ncbi:MAG: hypothetical protein HYU66_16385 [Armatimonadetes bacterium]|nr:hypothetical protein [Armatimonadota bacterium]
MRRDQDKVDHDTIFEEMARRAWRAAKVLRATGHLDNVRVALYLIGYAIEGRLKYLVCARYGLERLSEAQARLERERGHRLDLLGGQGHHLRLFWDLAGLEPDLRDGRVRADVTDLVNRWSPHWRYRVDSDIWSQRDEFFGAVERTYAFLGSKQ